MTWLKGLRPLTAAESSPKTQKFWGNDLIEGIKTLSLCTQWVNGHLRFWGNDLIEGIKTTPHRDSVGSRQRNFEEMTWLKGLRRGWRSTTCQPSSLFWGNDLIEGIKTFWMVFAIIPIQIRKFWGNDLIEGIKTQGRLPPLGRRRSLILRKWPDWRD